MGRRDASFTGCCKSKYESLIDFFHHLCKLVLRRFIRVEQVSFSDSHDTTADFTSFVANEYGVNDKDSVNGISVT
jgi:hypothetical protein